jgi:hypothetical protein
VKLKLARMLFMKVSLWSSDEVRLYSQRRCRRMLVFLTQG